MRLSLRGLRTQILAWSVLPTLIILLVVAYFSFWAYFRVTEVLVMDRNRELTRLLAGQMGLEMAEYADRLASLDEGRQRAQGQAPMPWLPYLAGHLPYLHDFDSGVVVVNETGLVIAADPRRLDLLGEDWSDRSHFRRVQTQPVPLLLSDIEYDGPEGHPVVAVAVPRLDDDDQIDQVMIGLFAVQSYAGSAFYRSLLRLDLRMESRVYLVDSQGRAIYHHDTDRIGTDVSDQAAVQAVQAGLVGAWRGYDGVDEEIVASYAPIPQTLASLIEEESWTDLRRISLGYGRVLVAILLFAVLVPAGIVSIAIRRITRPIKNLTIRADAISRGELGQIVDVPQGNELAALAQAFNRMSRRLESFYASLERRVEARTRELSAMNEIAGVVSQSLNLEDILAAALDKVLELMDMGAGTAYELEPGSNTLRLIAQRGLPSTALSERPEVELDEFLRQESLAEGAQVWPRERFPGLSLWQALAREGWHQVIMIPLVCRGELIGLLNLRARTPRMLGEQELKLLTGIGSQIGIALENARLYREAGALAAMAERNRLAHDLHDSVTQTIFTVNLLAGVIPALYEDNPDEAQLHLEELGRLTRSALNEMRALLLELRPATLAQTPLDELLARLGESTAGSARMPVHVSADSRLDIPPRVRVTLYRIAQEAINNVVKHSAADQAWIKLRRRRVKGQIGVELMIRDDGQGFDPSTVLADRLGLSIMRERASDIQATLEVQSAPGGGTTVRVFWIPEETSQEWEVPDIAMSKQRS